uniref:Uncharacterized protein n=1 Tax=Caenorhabditis japonica TaxID=281687 RepID=A0A8R1ER22_CAEJA
MFRAFSLFSTFRCETGVKNLGTSEAPVARGNIIPVPVKKGSQELVSGDLYVLSTRNTAYIHTFSFSNLSSTRDHP